MTGVTTLEARRGIGGAQLPRLLDGDARLAIVAEAGPDLGAQIREPRRDLDIAGRIARDLEPAQRIAVTAKTNEDRSGARRRLGAGLRIPRRAIVVARRFVERGGKRGDVLIFLFRQLRRDALF